MKIRIQVQGTKLLKFEKAFFGYLQKDNRFKELIMNSRKKLLLDVHIEKEDEELDITYKLDKPLRSEFFRIKGRGTSTIIESKFSVQLDNIVDEIIDQYPFIQDWRHGLRMFICGDRFLVSDESSSIKLRVRNKQYPLTGRFTDRYSDEGVKIVLTSRVSKKELNDWIDDNYEIINKYIDELPNQSKNTRRKNNYQRDKLIVYLRNIWKLKWSEIAKILADNGEPETSYETPKAKVIQAYKDFPSRG